MQMLKRCLIFFAAIFLCGFGIAITTQADLGTTPISSLTYVLTFMTPLSFGVTTFIINMVFIGIQKILLGKNFKKTDYLQIIVTLFFSFFIDLGMHIAGYFKSNNYIEQIVMLVVGSAVLALGVTLEVVADIMYVPGEGVVRAIAYKTGIQFGKIKIFFDVFQCLAAILLSISVLHRIRGLREGTILAAFLVGAFVCLYMKLLKRKQNCL